MEGLSVFLHRDDLPVTEEERHEVLRSPYIEKVICFVLAPAEANIPQACQMWLERVGIAGKTEIRFGKVPEEYIAEALTVTDTVAIFWTCAVFKREYNVFFQNTNTLPFFFEQVMRLDEMQLAGRTTYVDFNACLTIASHVSPAPLADSLLKEGHHIVDASSNGVAAQMCADGQVSLCITTESARKKHGLAKLHSFGSPEMVFFGGITETGAGIIANAYQQMQKIPMAV